MSRVIDEETLRLIGRVVREEAERLGVEVERVILFGSRARGEQREDSDWDLLVVVRKAEWRGVFKLQSRLRVRLFKTLGRETDLIIVDKDWFERRREMWGSLEHAAAKEGIVV